MTVKETPVNIRCLEYRQDKADTDYGSCLYARFYFNLDKYELNIISDVGNYAYQWGASEHESFLELMARITDDYLLGKLCGSPKEFDYEATKAHFYDYADDEDDKKHLDEIFEEIECNYIPDNGETFIELFEQENDGWWCDVWEYPIYKYTAWQKKIVSVFKNHIQPVIREIIKAEVETQEGSGKE
jgi:hypothetical protein